MITFRLEAANEAGLIYDLVHKTFGQEDEAKLVEDLCDDGDALISIVALDEEVIVGHILFSDIPVGTSKNLLRGAALAPVSVAEAYQRQGIGGGLVMEGLKECRKIGIQVVLVLGDPAYYGRFGFSATLSDNLDSPYQGEYFQALELQPGILEGITGKVLYPDAFKKLD
jgi:putative acetyltransferase